MHLKKIFASCLLLLLVLFGLPSSAQKNEKIVVPGPVTQSMKKQHSEAKGIKWDYSAKKERYEVKFSLKDKKYQAFFKPDGTWIRTERNIKKSQLPKPVIVAFTKSKYGKLVVEDVEEHQTPQHTTLYVIKVTLGKEKINVPYLPDGTSPESKPQKK